MMRGTVQGSDVVTEQVREESRPEPKPGGVARGVAPRRPFRAWIATASGVATWTWAVVVLAALLLIHWIGDGWWGVAVLLFLPRWLFLVPFPVLALASGWAGRPRHWMLQGAVALVVAGPLMRLS